jgi:hypothetical protein
MKSKPYKAKTLSGAQAKVRQMERNYRKLDAIAARYMHERDQLALMCADGPAFYHPLAAMAARTIRDRVLKENGYKPDGTRINPDVPKAKS